MIINRHLARIDDTIGPGRSFLLHKHTRPTQPLYISQDWKSYELDLINLIVNEA